MSDNYFRASAGEMVPRIKGHAPGESTFQTQTFAFDDEDPAARDVALFRAREAFPGAVVSVYRRQPWMPVEVPEIGMVAEAKRAKKRRSRAGVLQPGMASATRRHSTGLVGLPWDGNEDRI